MTGRGRRFAVRTGVAFAAAAVAILGTAAASEAGAKRFDIAVQYGYHNSIKLGQWMPVAVDITNNGPAMDGILEVEATSPFPGNGGPPLGTATYQTQISLAAGATKHIRTYVTQDSQGSVQVRVRQGNQVLASTLAATPSTWTGMMAGVISDQPGALDNLGIVLRSGVSPLIAHLAPADVSDSAPVLRAFDLIAIDDFATDSLTQGQKAALSDYVTQGGALLLGTGGSWHKTLAGLPDGLVPMQVRGSKVLESVTSLNGARNVEVVTGTLSAGATAWLTEGSQPLLVEAPAGGGIVEMATFDWTQDSVTTSTATTALLRQALVRSTYGNASYTSNGGAVAGKLGTTNSIATRGGSLTQVLGNLPALNLPAWWLIGALVFVYVLLAGPINYYVLSKVNRRALAWITVPAIAVAGSAGAYGAGVFTKGTSVLANEISIIHVAQGWERAYQEQYTGILTPTRGDYEVGLGSGRKMVSPIYYYSAINGDQNFGAMRVNTTTQSVTLPGMTAFTLRGFANEGVVAAPKVTGQIQFANGKLTGTVRNESSLSFTDGVVFAGNAYQKVQVLGPNGSLDLDVQLTRSSSLGGQPAYVSAYPNAYNGLPIYNPPDTERRNETRAAVLSTIFMNPMTGLGGPISPTLVLWTQAPFQDVTVNGGRPHTYAESAVVVTLPGGPITGALPSAVVPGRILDVDADISQGQPPGLIIAQAGWIIYSFSPPLAQGQRLTSASIDSSNPYGPKGVILGPNGAPAPAKTQVWDWSKSAWIDFSYQDNTSNPLPDSAVNPSTGAVRLRVGSEGQFQASSLSISGTVK